MRKTFIALLSLIAILCSAQEKEQAYKSPKGMIVVGTGKDVRVFQPFAGTATAGQRYAAIVNKYADHLNGKVRLYLMIIPEQATFYTPETVSDWSKPVQPAIQAVYDSVQKHGVTTVDAFTALQQHTDEAIYLRTDHHWAPLGAYYAAQAFAAKAKATFHDLSAYEPDTIHNFIGTMNRFSGNQACKNAPEDFIFFRPKNTPTTATFIKYKLNGSKVIGENAPVEEDFFYTYKQGSSLAYCTFMGGDSRTVKAKGNTRNGRILLITKDSFGNALPAYLFNSFEEIHIIDPRYYSKGLLTYIRQNNITDWLITNCVTFAHTAATAAKLEGQYK